MNEIQVYTVGIGSKDRLILGYDWFGRPQYAELDEVTLQKIASETGGHGYEIRAQAEIMKSFLIHYKRYMLGFII